MRTSLLAAPESFDQRLDGFGVSGCAEALEISAISLDPLSPLAMPQFPEGRGSGNANVAVSGAQSFDQRLNRTRSAQLP